MASGRGDAERGFYITRMDGQGGRRETGLRSHLETSASIKRRHGLETCDLTVQSLVEAGIKVWKVLYIYNEIAFRAFQSAVPLRELSGLPAQRVQNPKNPKNLKKISGALYETKIKHEVSEKLTICKMTRRELKVEESHNNS